MARLDRAHLLNLVRYLREGVLRQLASERAAHAAGNHDVEMWHAGARYAYRFAALAIGQQLVRQRRDDEQWRPRRRRASRPGARV